VVQPVHWIDYRRRPHSFRIILAIIHAAIHRRRGAVPDGYSWPRGQKAKAALNFVYCVDNGACVTALPVWDSKTSWNVNGRSKIRSHARG
jgi:hypothetical protein